MRAEFARVFAAERERVGWINTARDHSHQSFIFFRLRSRHLFKFQDFGCAISCATTPFIIDFSSAPAN